MKTEKEIEEINKVIELTEQLPEDVFAAVPDEDIVEIKISGAFSRAINKTLEYVINSVEPEEATRALEYIKKDYKECDLDKVGEHDVALWVLMNLLNEFNAQAGVQKKTKVYDKQAFMAGLTQKADAILPLTDDEISERLKKNQEFIDSKLIMKDSEEGDSDSQVEEPAVEDIEPTTEG